MGDLPTLKTLELHKNELKTAGDLPPLPALEKLNLGYNKIKKLELREYANLVTLEVQHNLLESIVGIENLKKIKEMRVEFNNLEEADIKDLLENIELGFLTAGYNNISEAFQEELTAMNKGRMGAASDTITERTEKAREALDVFRKSITDTIQ